MNSNNYQSDIDQDYPYGLTAPEWVWVLLIARCAFYRREYCLDVADSGKYCKPAIKAGMIKRQAQSMYGSLLTL